jgi:hypothetical protein
VQQLVLMQKISRLRRAAAAKKRALEDAEDEEIPADLPMPFRFKASTLKIIFIYHFRVVDDEKLDRKIVDLNTGQTDIFQRVNAVIDQQAVNGGRSTKADQLLMIISGDGWLLQQKNKYKDYCSWNWQNSSD